MKLLILILLLFTASFSIAQVCPTTSGTVRPDNEPANYAPIGEPVCLPYTTNGAY